MTTSNDFDRALAAWLEDGPNRAPERPVESAIDHARSNPRRRDLFSFLRSDPMASRSGFSMSPALVFAVVGLLVLGGAVAVVGSMLTNPSVVPPLESPTSSPTPVPTPAVFEVDLLEQIGVDATIEVEDRSLQVVSVTSVEPAEGPTVEAPTVSTRGEPRQLRLTWPGTPCEERYRLTIDETAHKWLIQRPVCQGDAIGLDRVLIIEFAVDVAPEDVDVSLVAGS